MTWNTDGWLASVQAAPDGRGDHAGAATALLDRPAPGLGMDPVRTVSGSRVSVTRYPLLIGADLAAASAARPRLPATARLRSADGCDAAAESTAEVPSRSAAWRAVFISVFVILLNLALTGASYELARAGVLPVDTLISIGLAVGLAFYGVVAWVAVKGMAGLDLQPVWRIGPTIRAVVTGATVGLTAAGIVMAAQYGAVGHMGDADVSTVVSDGTTTRIALAFLLFAVAAPVVEELVFRGILYQGLTRWGRRAAALVSALLFGVAHLRPEALVYYTLVGLLLAGVYRRRGLSGSIATHAAFNGALVVATVMSVFGAGTTVNVSGATIRVSGAWHQVPAPAYAGQMTALQGPGGAVLLAESTPVPTGATWSPAQAASLWAPRAAFTLPGSTVATTTVLTVPAGPALKVRFNDSPSGGEAFVVAGGGRAWVLVLVDEGSSRAEADFPGIVQSLKLPATGAPA